MKYSVTHVQNLVYVLTNQIGLPAYDFDFTNHFPCKHPQFWPDEIEAVSRIGATNDYEKRYNDLLSNNIRLIHSPEDYRKTSFLPSCTRCSKNTHHGVSGLINFQNWKKSKGRFSFRFS